MTEIIILLAFVVLIYVGPWIADRWLWKPKEPSDNATMVLCIMATRCINQRKFVGPTMQVTTSEIFDLAGERFTLSLTMHPAAQS